MHIDLSQEQLNILVDLVSSRIKEIHPEIRRSRIHTVHDELQHDLEALQDLLSKLEQEKDEKLTEEWEGYAETRDVPSNPPPAS